MDLERVLRWACSWFEGGLEVGLECFVSGFGVGLECF